MPETLKNILKLSFKVLFAIMLIAILVFGIVGVVTYIF